jgi:TolB-like protein/class 3 adenylate cyclase/cytochrome c-type biogenesis protein CcmH/NrfG
MERKLAAILAADVVGYSRLMEVDEAGTLAALKAHRDELIDPKIAEHKGRIVKLMGDGALVEFASVVDAVACALAIQKGMAGRNEDVPEDRRIALRIGVHLGDVMVEGDDLYGDGVNVAARLEGLAEPGGVCISQQAFDQVETKLDLAYEDLGEQRVKNIARPVRAYRVRPEGAAPPEPETAKRRGPSAPQLIGSAAIVVLVVAGLALAWWQPWRPDVAPAAIERMAFPLPEKPSIAVLPFDNLSAEPEQAYLSDGLSENIITELSRFKEFFVIARNSTFAYKGGAVKVRQVAEELGVRYVVEGSVQTSGDRLRVTAQLIDATSGKHLWAERFDRELRDIFAVQDEITRTIAATLEENIDLVERKRATTKPVENLKAYELVMRGRAAWMTWTKEGNEESKRLAEKALELDADYSEAYVRLAWAHINGYRWGWSDTHSREDSLALALETARKAIELDPFSHRARWVLANATMQSGDLDRAIAEYDRAIELNPNSARVLVDSAEPLVYLGRAQDAISRIKAAIRLNPRHPDWYLWNLGWAQYYAELYVDALASLRKMNKMPNNARRTLASALVRLGRLEEARAVIAEFRKNAPEYTLEEFKRATEGKFKNQADLDRALDDLRTAGLPDIKPASRENLAFPLPEAPSIAVLPFDNLSGDPEQDPLVEAITDNIVTTLARMPRVFVIARDSTSPYKDQPAELRKVAEDLGIQYLLNGSFQRAGDKVRVTARLSDALSGRHLWAERYDRVMADIFAIQDDIALNVAAALQVVLSEGEKAQIVRPPTKSLEAWNLAIEADTNSQQWTGEGKAKARALLAKAVELDPDFLGAWLSIGWTHWADIRFGWTDTPEDSLRQAEEAAERALSIDAGHPDPYSLLEGVYLIRGAHDRALAYGEKALALNPNGADNLASHAIAQYFAGAPEAAERSVKRAMRLNPGYPMWYLLPLEEAYRLSGRYDQAIETIQEELRRLDQFFTRTRLALYYAQSGRDDQARAEIARVLQAKPDMNLEYWANAQYFKDAKQNERDAADLKRVGLPERPPLKLPDKPSIAVLPFSNMSGDPEQDYFADGITEDLTTDLSKISGLFVIARNSAFAYQGKNVEVKRAARELGVEYVLEGSVRRAGDQVRINAQLIDAGTGGHLWAERYDGTLDDVFALQDRVTRRIVTALAVTLTPDEARQAASAETDNVAAYDAFLQGWEHYRQWNLQAFGKAVPHFKKAVELDPEYSRAYAALASIYYVSWRFWGEKGEKWPEEMGVRVYYEALDVAKEYLRSAMRRPTPLAHLVASSMHLRARRHEEAIAEAEHGLALDPNDADSHAQMATVLTFAGRADDAIRFAERAMRLDPHYPPRYLGILGRAEFSVGRLDEAAVLFERLRERQPDDQIFLPYHAAAYALLDRDAEAQALLADYRGYTHTITAFTKIRFKKVADFERFARGLVKAGVCCRDELERLLVELRRKETQAAE